MNGQKLHFVLVPLMAQGHMIPMVDIAQLFAEHGVVVSFITTPFNASRIKATIDSVEESGLPIQFISLRFPCAEAGLPEGCENADVLPSRDLLVNFFNALPLLREPLILYLRQQQLRPSCIVSDMCHPWTQEVAVEFGIPRLSFQGFSCFASLCSRNIRHHKVLESITDQTQPFVVPGLSPRIEITKEQSPGFFSGPSLEKIRNAIVEGETMSAGLVVNTFDDLEAQYIESYQKTTGKKAWTMGPVSLYNKDAAYRIARGNQASVDEGRCLSWLDSMKPQSVVYVSFGSLTRTSPTQAAEIGLGLEASDHPFIWVIKAGDKDCEVERWLSEEEFEQRTKGRSLVIRGWAPQVTILSHPAVGGFLTHCGWNSTLESISAGVPMVTWPQFAEQFLNEKLVVEVLGVGVSVEVKTPTQWGVDGGGTTVRGEEIKRAVRKLMDEGEVGEGIRKRAAEFGEMARKAMEIGGSSRVNITHLIQEIMHHARGEKEVVETKTLGSEGAKDEYRGSNCVPIDSLVS